MYRLVAILKHRMLSLAKSPQQVFLVISLVFGITFIFLTPPFMAPDEWMHFRRAYHISEGHLVAEKISFMGREIAGGIIPDRELIIEIFALNSYPYSVENERLMLPSLINQGDDNFQSGRKFKIDNILTLFRQTVPPTSDEPLSFVYFPFTARYSPHLYFPQATGIELGKLIGLPMIALLYMGRLFNLLLWVFLIYLAIRVTPVSKWLFLLFALTPTSLFLSSSSSADAVTNGLSILFIACLLQLAFGDNRNRFLVAAIFALALLVSISKGYFLLIFLFLIVPKDRIGGGKKYWGLFLLLVVLTIITVSAYSYFVNKVLVPLDSISPHDQLRFILKDPLGYLSLFAKVTLSLPLMANIIRMFVGRLGHFSPYLPAWLIYLHMIVLFFVALIKNDENITLLYKDRIVFSVIFLLSFFVICTLKYLTWTPVGDNTIEGLDGQYFIPIAPLLFLMVHNKRLSVWKYRAETNSAISCYSFLILLLSAFVMLKGYYL